MISLFAEILRQKSALYERSRLGKITAWMCIPVIFYSKWATNSVYINCVLYIIYTCITWGHPMYLENLKHAETNGGFIEKLCLM